MSDFSSKLFLLFCFDWQLEWFKQNNFISCDVVKKEIWYHHVALVFQQLRYFVLAHKDQISNEQSLNLDLGQGYSKSKKWHSIFQQDEAVKSPLALFKKNTFLVQVALADVIVISLGETLQRHQKTASDLPLPTIEKKTRGQRVRFWPFELCRSNGPTADAINLLQLYRYTVRFEQRACKQIHSYN